MFAGSEISTNLLQVLQKKLDDAVLEMLLLALLRNSMTKLTVEDVQVCKNRKNIAWFC
jgi:hypothetical protein